MMIEMKMGALLHTSLYCILWVGAWRRPSNKGVVGQNLCMAWCGWVYSFDCGFLYLIGLRIPRNRLRSYTLSFQFAPYDMSLIFWLEISTNSKSSSQWISTEDVEVQEAFYIYQPPTLTPFLDIINMYIRMYFVFLPQKILLQLLPHPRSYGTTHPDRPQNSQTSSSSWLASWVW